MVLRSTVYKQNKNKKYIYYIQKNAIKHINNLLVYLPPIILRSTVYKQFFTVDLKTMGDRLKNRYYCHKKLFMADINRIFTNCRSYNKPDTEYYKCANVTEKFFLTKWKDAGLGEKT
jgi:hypothetical protein